MAALGMACGKGFERIGIWLTQLLYARSVAKSVLAENRAESNSLTPFKNALQAAQGEQDTFNC